MFINLRPYDDYLKQRPKGQIIFICITALLSVAGVDFITGAEISVSVFYLLPILIGTWYVDRKTGIMLSVASMLLWLAADLSGGHQYSNPAIPLWNSTVRFMFFTISTYMLSFIKFRLEFEAELASTDPLTRILNRRAFFKQCAEELERSLRYGSPMSLAYFDLDNFKEVNDTLGHETGDTLLKTVADIMQTSTRKTDSVARLGGDEFAVLFSMSDFRTSEEAMRKVHDLLNKKMKENGWPVTFSIGMITFRGRDGGIDELLNAADRLMYTIKKDGKNAMVHTLWPGEQ